jgi:hypothetical protein
LAAAAVFTGAGCTDGSDGFIERVEPPDQGTNPVPIEAETDERSAAPTTARELREACLTSNDINVCAGFWSGIEGEHLILGEGGAWSHISAAGLPVATGNWELAENTVTFTGRILTESDDVFCVGNVIDASPTDIMTLVCTGSDGGLNAAANWIHER